MNNRLINTKVAGGGGGCTDIVDNYDPFGGGGLALYQLNGDANDVSTNYNGTWSGTAAYTTGVFGQSANLSGSNYITMSGLTSFFTPKQTFTVSLWFKTSGSNVSRYLFSDEAFSFGNNYNITISQAAAGWLSIATIYGGVSSNYNTTTTYKDNAWHNIVVTINQSNQTGTVYIDGAFSGSYTLSTGTKTGTPYPVIGTVGNAYLPFIGQIDQVRIFNTALDPLEIEALYTEEICICDGTVDTLDILGDGSCIATYTLDGNANDLSGNYSGTPTNVSYGVGEFDLAGVFNGSSSVIRDIPNSISTSLKSNNAFTYSFWIKFNSLGYQSIIQFFNDVTSSVSFNGTNFEAYIYNSSLQQKAVINSATVTTGVWYNVVFKGDSNGIFLYVNNNTPASTSWGGDWFIYTNATYKYNAIGARQNSGGFTDYVDGSIDQVRIFNKALNSTEVTTLYNETACTYTPSACVDVFSDNSGISLYQLNGNAFDLDRRLDGAATNVTWGGAGVFGTSANMKTLQGYIITPTAIYDNSFSGHSVSFWMYSGGTNYEAGIYTRTAAEAASGWHIRTSTSGNGINFSWQNSSGSVVFGSSELSYTFAFGWHHVVATWDGTTDTNGAKLYVDGSLLDQRTANETLASQTFTLGATLGGDRQSAGRSIQGLDQVRFFNRELTSTEVTTLYTSDASCG
jgi:hypothetical protein